MKRKAFFILILWAIPPFAMALSLGDLSVESALHEPLRASIPIQNQGATPADEIKARISPVQVSDIISLEQTQLLSSLEFVLKTDHEGQLRLTISTRKAMEEPFLRLPIVISWPDGELLREYTLFFDPPQRFIPTATRTKSTQNKQKLTG